MISGLAISLLGLMIVVVVGWAMKDQEHDDGERFGYVGGFAVSFLGWIIGWAIGALMWLALNWILPDMYWDVGNWSITLRTGGIFISSGFFDGLDIQWWAVATWCGVCFAVAWWAIAFVFGEKH